MPAWEHFAKDTIIDQLAARTKEDALDEMLDALVSSKRITAKDVTAIKRKLREREKLGSTGIGNGVAVPHIKTSQVEQILVCLGRCVEGIEFQAIDGRPVHCIFLILAPAAAADDHRDLLRWISGLVRDKDFVRFLTQAKGKHEILDLLKEKSL
jgi:mannitol/fructose-specific phosphotransferase system IIA component (Ntr-type)